MLEEYAVDPSAVGQTYDRARYLLELFGLDRGRYIARFPKSWEDLVLESFKASSSFKDVQNKRLVDMLERARGNRVIDTPRHYNGGDAWLSNALAQHALRPFKAIIADCEGPEDCVVGPEEADAEHPLLLVARTCSVPQTASDLALALAPLAALSNRIKLIDPHFDLGQKRYAQTLFALLRKLEEQGRTGATVELHYRTHDKRASPDYVKTKARRWVRGCIPTGYKLELYEWLERPGGERMHDRFLIGEVGGIKIGIGFDTGGANKHANLVLLDIDHAEATRRYFTSPSPAFDLVHPVIVIDHRGAVSSSG